MTALATPHQKRALWGVRWEVSLQEKVTARGAVSSEDSQKKKKEKTTAHVKKKLKNLQLCFKFNSSCHLPSLFHIMHNVNFWHIPFNLPISHSYKWIVTWCERSNWSVGPLPVTPLLVLICTIFFLPPPKIWTFISLLLQSRLPLKESARAYCWKCLWGCPVPTGSRPPCSPPPRESCGRGFEALAREPSFQSQSSKLWLFLRRRARTEGSCPRPVTDEPVRPVSLGVWRWWGDMKSATGTAGLV